MYSRTTLGNFYPINSIIHKLNPTNKFICLLLYVIFLISSLSLRLHFIMFAFLVFIMLISLVPFRFYFNIIFSTRYILTFLTFALLLSSVKTSLTIIIILKIVMSIIIISVLTFTTSPSELSYGIEKFLNLFNIFSINLSKFINGIVNAIRFIPMLITNEYIVLKAVEARGINYSYADIISRFFVKRKMFGSAYYITKRKMRSIRNEANLRMYDYKKYRTNYRVNHFGFNDLIYFLVFTSLIILDAYERGVLDALLNKF